jgi:dihydrofolate reductase
MGRVIYSLSVSLDGYAAGPDGSLDFVHIDEPIHRLLNDQQATVSVHVYGRRMWETMAATWPTWDRNPAATPWEVEWARIWQAMPKVVVSRTLERVDEPNTELVRDAAADVVRDLRSTLPGEVSVGGPTIAASLIEADLIDELRLLVQPVVLGQGLPYLPREGPRRDVRLLEHAELTGGVTYLRYERRR